MMALTMELIRSWNPIAETDGTNDRIVGGLVIGEAAVNAGIVNPF